MASIGAFASWAYEVLNLVDGRRSTADVRDAVAAIYGPVPQELVTGYVGTLEKIGIVSCDGGSVWQAPTAPLAERAPRFPPPESTVELGVAGLAKVLCSAVFVSGRQLDEARSNTNLMLSDDDRAKLTVDREDEEIRVTWDGRLTRTARFYGDQGCVIVPRGRDGVFFEPVKVTTTLPDASTQPWPMGDAPSEEPLPPEVDAERLRAAVDAAFSDPEALTAAFVVVHVGASSPSVTVPAPTGTCSSRAGRWARA